MAKLIFELSGPRVGSTAFRYALRGFSRIEALGELLNPRSFEPYGWEEAFTAQARKAGHDIEDGIQAMRAFCVANPLEAVEIGLRTFDGLGAEYGVLKLAPGHLGAPLTDALLRRFRPAGIVLRRNPADQYISREKALSLRAWRGVDTTDIKPELEVGAFRAFRRRQQNHYQMGCFLMRRHGLPYRVLDYQELIDARTPLRQRLPDLFASLGMELGAYDDASEQMRKQDKSTARADKVQNWDAFQDALRTQNALHELDMMNLDGATAVLRAQLLGEGLLPRSTLRRLATRVGMSGMPTRRNRSASGSAP
ncbi:MAG: hypothetical protein AAF919_01435 [Pseudomonadota bacterium]